LPALPTAGRLRQASGATRRACPACPESVEGSVVEGHRRRNAPPPVRVSLDTAQKYLDPSEETTTLLNRLKLLF
jgi:hypothetical protein